MDGFSFYVKWGEYKIQFGNTSKYEEDFWIKNLFMSGFILFPILFLNLKSDVNSVGSEILFRICL